MFNKKFIYVFLFVFIFYSCFLSFNIFAVDDSIYVWSNSSSESIESSSSIDKTGNFLEIACGSGILIEQSTGKILYEYNSHEQLRPASVTKVMTILLIMEALDSGKISLQDTVDCSEHAASMGGSQIWLEPSEKLTVDEMLKAICVVSANDCCVAMAEFISGSEELFVEQMNLKAKELGMNDTCFKNCHGLDEDGHLTSSNDIALMSRELLKNHPSITKYTTIWMDSLRNGESELVNTNKLLRNYDGCTGLKTGSTSTALFNLSASATRNDLSLIAVVMRGETSAIRFSDAKKLLDYGFSNYQFASCCRKNDLVEKILVNKGTSSSVDAIIQNDFGALVEKGVSDNIESSIILNSNVSAPIIKGQKLGEVSYSINGESVGIVDIIAEKDVKKLTLGNIIASVLVNWYNLLR